MKKIIIIATSLLFIMAIVTSCGKEDVKTDLKNSGKTGIIKNKSSLPPINWFECGPPNPSSPYPCPNASCPYMGWDCAFEVVIHGVINRVAYDRAAELLDSYIKSGHTGEFFRDYPEEVALLMPEVAVSERSFILDDLKNEVTSVKKHPVFSKEFNEEINIYQIFVTETGESPNYGDL